MVRPKLEFVNAVMIAVCSFGSSRVTDIAESCCDCGESGFMRLRSSTYCKEDSPILFGWVTICVILSTDIHS